MTFYSKLLENILSDSIPAKMGKIGWMEKLVSEMIAEIIDRSFDFREEGTTGMHNAAKAVMCTCEFIENEEDDFSETRHSSGIPRYGMNTENTLSDIYPNFAYLVI